MLRSLLNLAGQIPLASLSCYLMMWVTGSVSAQNLVPNPNFENYTNCPNTISQIEFAFPWIAPTEGTPDFIMPAQIQSL